MYANSVKHKHAIKLSLFILNFLKGKILLNTQFTRQTKEIKM